MVSKVTQIWPPEWCSVVRINVDVETNVGNVRLRYLYDKASGSLLKASQTRGVSCKDIGLSRGQTDELLRRVEKHCKRLVTKTETLRKNKEELKEFRKRKAERTKPKQRKKGVEERPEQKSLF